MDSHPVGDALCLTDASGKLPSEFWLYQKREFPL